MPPKVGPASSSGNRIRVWNPAAKPWTLVQAAARKDMAERFTREVLEDDERADQIAEMTPEEYAQERGKQINPFGHVWWTEERLRRTSPEHSMELLRRAHGDPHQAAKMASWEVTHDRDYPKRRTNSMKRRVSVDAKQQSAVNPLPFLKREDKLRKENEQLKAKVQSLQDTLDEIADLAEAPADGSAIDADSLAEKMDQILDLAAPESANGNDNEVAANEEDE